ncbi:MAG: multidrug transporter subunit MdtD [Burkholderiaceae bacterium]|nr:multidrug transporter subunit MdtD [Burkholderiaceae bacterium]
MNSSQRSKLLLLAAVGFFMQTLDSTIVNTALPAMARSLGESPLRMQSVVVAYALTMAMLIPASGWMADRFGTRRVYFGAITLFVLGSLLCALSRNLDQLVAARVVQGMGGAMLLPVGRLAVLHEFPRDKFLRAMAFVAIPGLIGPVLGPTLGGLLVEYASWHWIFLINIPVGLAGCVATLFYMPQRRSPKPRGFDLGGYLLLAFGMVGVSLALDGLSGMGLGRASAPVLLMFGLASLCAYWLHAARHPEPLFSPRLFSVPNVSIGLLGNLFSRTGSSCMPFLIPLLLQLSMGYSPAQAGMMMLPVAMSSLVSKSLSTRLIVYFGYRRVLVSNTILVGLVIASFSLTSIDQPLWLRLMQLGFFGAVNSLQFTAMNAIMLKDLDGELASSGNSLLSMVQMLAMSLGVAAAGTVLGAYSEYFSRLGSQQILQSFQATFATVGLMTMASAWIFWQLSPDTRRAAGEQDPPEAGS